VETFPSKGRTDAMRKKEEKEERKRENQLDIAPALHS